MLRKIIIIIILIFGFCFSQDFTWQEINTKILNISNNYQKGKAREVMKSYGPANDAYILALKDSHELLASPQLGKEQVMEVLPYMLASSYRLAIATEKMVNAQMTYLYDQVERYKQANELITQSLAQISNLRLDKRMEIPDIYYSHLYYARALINNAMAYTLANGTIWQRYFIYMPSDIVMLMDNVITDLEHYLFLNKITERNQIETQTSKFIADILPKSHLDKILSLSYYLDDKPVLARALRQRYENIFNYLERYKQNKDFYRQIAEIKVYENYEKSDQAKKYIENIKELLDILKNN